MVRYGPSFFVIVYSERVIALSGTKHRLEASLLRWSSFSISINAVKHANCISALKTLPQNSKLVIKTSSG